MRKDHINLASFHMEYRIIIVMTWIPSGTDHDKPAEHKRKLSVYTLARVNISLQIRETNGLSHQTSPERIVCRLIYIKNFGKIFIFIIKCNRYFAQSGKM